MRKKLARLQAIRKIQRKIWLKSLIKPLLVISIIALILSSCIWVLGHMGDPIQNLTFVNRTRPPVTVILEKAQTPSDFLEQPITQYELGQGHREKMLMFGIGRWSEAEIARVGSQIHKITILAEDKTIVYDKPEQIQRLLQENWVKSGKENTIKIEVK